MGRGPQVHPDQLAAMRLRAAFGPMEVLEVIDLALAVILTTGLEGQHLQVARQPVEIAVRRPPRASKMRRLEFGAHPHCTDQTERRTRAMADLLIQSGNFATNSVVILASRDFSGVMEVRFAFTVTANPNGFVASALPADGSEGAGALITGTGVHVVVPGQIPAGSYVFQIESQGGTVAASSYSIFVRDPNEPEPPAPPPFEPPTTEPPLKVVKADEEIAPGYDDSR